MEIKGIIKVIGEVSQVTDSFKKRDLVITTEEQYPQHITIQFVQDRCSMLDGRHVGDNVTVGINLRGKEYTPATGGDKKYFNSIDGWKISGEQKTPQIKKVDKQLKDDLPF